MSPRHSDPTSSSVGRPRQRPRALLVAGALATIALLAGACGGSTGTAEAPPSSLPPGSSSTPAPGSDPGAIDARISLAPVVDGLDQPTALAPRPDGEELWVTEQGGAVRRITRSADVDPATGRPGPVRHVLDPEPLLELGELTRGRGEQGLLGIAFDATGDVVYLYHTLPVGDVVVAEYAVEATGDEVGIDAGSRRVLLTIPHREFSNHNGGQLALGPDGFLYVGVGDGGGSGDPGDNGQDTGELLGKILRIDPSSPDGASPYTVPASNPFVAAAARRRSSCTGPGTRGASASTGPPATCGWPTSGRTRSRRSTGSPPPRVPGSAPTSAGTGDEGDRPFRDGTPPDGLVDPVHVYDHDGGNCSVTGGYVYRGEKVPALEGVYLYGDYCVGDIRGLLVRDGVVVDERSLGVGVAENSLVSFGQAVDGELYVLSQEGTLFAVEQG